MRTWILMATLMMWPLDGTVADELAGKQPDTIQWVQGLDAALRLSGEDGRPTIAYFTFDACVWCKRLEEACFSDPQVVRLSRKFHWVKVNRDHTPEIPQKLNVSAYPSLLTLGRDLENVYRFQSYQEPPEFIGNLEAALERYGLYKQGQEWMLPETRPERIISEGHVDPLPAPSAEVPGGITVLRGTIWVAQGELFQLEAPSGRVLARHALPSSVGDLCSDGKYLYALTYGWTAGQPIYMIDPASGAVVREIVTEANKQTRSHGAKGIAWHDGQLYVLSGMVGKVFQVDIDSGQVVDEVQLAGTWLSGLDFHNGNLICGGRTDLWQFDRTTGKLIRQIASNYPIRNIASHSDAILLMEQPEFGFGRKHERIQVWPQQTQIYRWSDQP